MGWCPICNIKGTFWIQPFDLSNQWMVLRGPENFWGPPIYWELSPFVYFWRISEDWFFSPKILTCRQSLLASYSQGMGAPTIPDSPTPTPPRQVRLCPWGLCWGRLGMRALRGRWGNSELLFRPTKILLGCQSVQVESLHQRSQTTFAFMLFLLDLL